ncbi:MAG: hypothetical protein AB7N76_04120 [Planctomycetota bacterium]
MRDALDATDPLLDPESSALLASAWDALTREPPLTSDQRDRLVAAQRCGGCDDGSWDPAPRLDRARTTAFLCFLLAVQDRRRPS